MSERLARANIKALALSLEVGGPAWKIAHLGDVANIRALLAYHAPERQIKQRKQPDGSYLVWRVQ
jgi:hypothetical protein